MATIKNFTSLEQSKKLAEILPLESADMRWLYITAQGKYIAMMHEEPDPHYIARMESYGIKDAAIRCWSLAALLDVLPPYLYEFEKGIDFNLYPSITKKRWWCAGYISQDLSPENKDKFTFITHADNPIDACVAMIEKLHELKML